ncbi:MAG: LysE family transporter [Bacteroidaceae bacterium]|nr:LysE family transporter [Bacteroidaceae bacterium]
MNFPLDISYIDVIFKGVLIGILVSAPMGPVGVLCVQRTLNKGRWYGFVTGIGACISDLIYAVITGAGVSFVVDFIEENGMRFWLQLAGSIILMIFGIHAYKSDPTKNMHISGKQKGTLFHNGLTAFLITFCNPLIIFLFMACFAQLAFVPRMEYPLSIVVSFLSIALGALLWWWCLTWIIDKVRTNFNNNAIIMINKIIGGVVIFISILVLFGTIFNIYSFG